ncbi:MAG: hypothetical protein HY675_08800 [Chloroflexi bacterium]|nr:hypothetical protein [Chloroflexota bacterium]
MKPRHILDAVGAAPLLQQPDVKKHYFGLQVSWRGELVDASRISAHSVRLLVGGSPAILAHVRPDDYPGLGLLKKGDPVQISGVIEDIDMLYITLTGARIEFDVPTGAAGG